MVKNTFGGNKHKGQARKTVIGNKQTSQLRIIQEDGELYAQVIKIYGGPLCSVHCIDNIIRNCVIRKKFRSKRDCIIRAGSWILIGLRQDLSVIKGNVETCDLLEVYNDIDKERLKKQQPNANWKIFLTSTTNEKGDVINQEGDFEFSDKNNDEFEELMKKEIDSTTGIFNTVITFDNEQINLDDI